MRNLMPLPSRCRPDHSFLQTVIYLAIASLAVAILLADPTSQSAAQPPAAELATADQATRASAAIKQRISSGQFDEAAKLALQQFDAIEPGNDEAAKWAIILSKLRVEILLRWPIASEQPLVAAATEPVERILTAYPDHRFAAWLRFQRLAVDTAVARRRGLAIQAAPGDDTQRLSALASLIKTAGGLRDLQDEVVASISAAFAKREQPARLDQLMSLRNAIATERVGVLLSRGELFPADSDDFLAAAAEANQAAIDALAMVRDDPALQSDLVTMRCDALLRMGQPDEAARLMAPLVAASVSTEKERQPLSDPARAMAVRIAIELNQLSAARQWLDAHYGDQPNDAPPSPQSDLARLRFLIASKSAATEQWIEAIGKRGGDYLYRQAQTIAIELLGPDAANSAGGDLVIAEAGVLMRKGDATAAASLLEAQLRKTTDAQSALKMAKLAAAVLARTNRLSDAANLLAETSRRFAADDGAADLMLQAAVMQDQIGEATKTDQVLRELISRWPAHQKSMLARDWLIDRTEKTATTIATAIAATPDPATDAAVVAAIVAANDDPDERREIEVAHAAAWQRAETFWIRAFAEVDPFDESLQLSAAFGDLRQQAAESLDQSKSPAALRCRKTIATLFQDTQRLSVPEFHNLPIDEKPLIEWLYAIRTGGAITDPPASQDNELRAIVGVALMIEGQETPTMRATLGNAMISLLSDVPKTELLRGQALVWIGNWQLAPELLDRWIAGQASGDQYEVAAMQAAKLLSQSNDPAAKQMAMERYLKLSKESSTKSPRWHRIKLATIESMVEAKKPDEAKQLARYVLITRPPADEATKKRYEDFGN
jgi:hypothetical protein